jgi:hypothetical protein
MSICFLTDGWKTERRSSRPRNPYCTPSSVTAPYVRPTFPSSKISLKSHQSLIALSHPPLLPHLRVQKIAFKAHARRIAHTPKALGESPRTTTSDHLEAGLAARLSRHKSIFSRSEHSNSNRLPTPLLILFEEMILVAALTSLSFIFSFAV